jgi:hypothetical protein
MTDNPFNIPFEALNQFYFQEFRDSLYPSLQPYISDKRILHHAPDEEHITTLAHFTYRWHHAYVPYMLDDLFHLSDEILLSIGKAWLLWLIDLVLVDNTVDKQDPGIPTAILFQRHLRTCADDIMRKLLPQSSLFWQHYTDAHQVYWNALAHEAYCVDQHQKPFTLDEMKQANDGKLMFYYLFIEAMTELSDRLDYIEPIRAIYYRINLMDLLLDDILDWKEDFARGRILYPLVLALEAESVPLAQAISLTEDEVQALMTKHNVAVQIAEDAITVIQEAIDRLKEIGCMESKLGRVAQERMQAALDARRIYQNVRPLYFFIEALKRG